MFWTRKRRDRARSLGLVAATLVVVIGFSLVSLDLWGGKSEKAPQRVELTLDPNRPLQQVAGANQLPPPLVAKALGVPLAQLSEKTLADLGISPEQASSRIRQFLALKAEKESKNWVKILAKFALWFAFLPIPFVLLRRKAMTPKRRRWLLAASVVLFGIALGSDPSPMGTVKDAVVLGGETGAVFLPRMIALGVFLATVVLANKFICSWGCQFGVLQDLVHRIARGGKDRKSRFRQVKPPFWLSNGVRIAVFAALTLGAFLWSFDLISPIDPFKVYSPAALGIAGAVFVLLVLAAGLFVYRPWCHFACPFGLVSWLFERISIFHIKVDYSICDRCEVCTKTCPSQVMKNILHGDKVVADCFACGSCIDICPTNAIGFTAARREKPPVQWWDQECDEEDAEREQAAGS